MGKKTNFLETSQKRVSNLKSKENYRFYDYERTGEAKQDTLYSTLFFIGKKFLWGDSVLSILTFLGVNGS